MKDVRIDHDGSLRCWNCGAKGFTEKRTLRSKALVGVGALLTKKKLKCQNCGEYNDTGNEKPYEGPADRKWRKLYEREQAELAASVAAAASPPTSVADELKKLIDLRDTGTLTEDEFAHQKALLLGNPGGDTG
jgi:DNA-directed RNA polymerase subunit RPC12/RpoP